MERIGTDRRQKSQKTLILLGFTGFLGLFWNSQDGVLVEVSGIEPLTSCMPCKNLTHNNLF